MNIFEIQSWYYCFFCCFFFIFFVFPCVVSCFAFCLVFLLLLFRILAQRKDKAHNQFFLKNALICSVRLPHVLLRFFFSSSSSLLSWVLQECDTAGGSSNNKAKKKSITFENPTPRELRSVANCLRFYAFFFFSHADSLLWGRAQPAWRWWWVGNSHAFFALFSATTVAVEVVAFQLRS